MPPPRKGAVHSQSPFPHFLLPQPARTGAWMGDRWGGDWGPRSLPGLAGRGADCTRSGPGDSRVGDSGQTMGHSCASVLGQPRDWPEAEVRSPGVGRADENGLGELFPPCPLLVCARSAPWLRAPGCPLPVSSPPPPPPVSGTVPRLPLLARTQRAGTGHILATSRKCDAL